MIPVKGLYSSLKAKTVILTSKFYFTIILINVAQLKCLY